MNYRLVADRPRSHALVFERGEEVVSRLLDFAAKEEVWSGTLQGIGAFSRATLAFFDVARRSYEEILVSEDVEVCSLLGNITMYEGAPRVHVHTVLGKADLSTVGGHLVEATVGPTLEVVTVELGEALERAFDESLGLPLIRL